MSIVIFAAARTPTQPAILATSVSQSIISVSLVTPSVEPKTGIRFYRLQRRSGTSGFAQIAQLTGTQFPYLDTGLVSGTMYLYRLIAVNNALNADSSMPSAVSSASTVNTVGPMNFVKWHPGHYMLSNGVNQSPAAQGGGAQNIFEYDRLAAAGVNIQGWVGQYTWDFIEKTTLGVYNFAAFDADYLNLQATCPGKRMGILVGTYKNTVTNPSNVAAAWRINAPAYILNDTTGLYGPLGPNGVNRGYGLTQQTIASPTTSNFQYNVAFARRDIATVSARFAAMFAALANRLMPDGSGLTYNQHPLIELVGDFDEYSIGYGPPYTASGYNSTTEVTAWSSFYTTLGSSWPNTLINSYLTFGNSLSTTRVADLQAIIAACASAGNVAFSAPDSDPPWLSEASTGAQLAAGNTYTLPDGGTLIPGGGTDRRLQMPFFATVQGDDYGAGSPGSNNQAQTTAIYRQAIANNPTVGATAANGQASSHILWDLENLLNTSQYWENQVYPIISNPANQTLQTIPASLAGRTVT